MDEINETVYTVTDYYDGPRGGIADYEGKPHAYCSLWAESEDGADTFLLRPIDDETFRLALEDWAIWQRWRRAFDAGQTTIETHPALPADRQRHDELSKILRQRLHVDPERGLRVRGKFTVRTPSDTSDGSIGHWVIHWLPNENKN